MRVESVLIDIVSRVEGKQFSPSSQIEGKQARREGRRSVGVIFRVWVKPGRVALIRIAQRRISAGIPIAVDARVVEGRVSDAESEVFKQPRLL